MTKALAFCCLSNAWGVRGGKPWTKYFFSTKDKPTQNALGSFNHNILLLSSSCANFVLGLKQDNQHTWYVDLPSCYWHSWNDSAWTWMGADYTREIKTPTHLIFVKHPFFFSSNIKRKIQPLIIMPQTQRTLRCAIQLPLEFESDHSCIKSKITLARMLSSWLCTTS